MNPFTVLYSKFDVTDEESGNLHILKPTTALTGV